MTNDPNETDLVFEIQSADAIPEAFGVPTLAPGDTVPLTSLGEGVMLRLDAIKPGQGFDGALLVHVTLIGVKFLLAETSKKMVVDFAAKMIVKGFEKFKVNGIDIRPTATALAAAISRK